MTLQQTLQAAQTEEDIKDAYVKALGLKAVNKGLIDIQTEEFWFEAKLAPTPPAAMFAQLLSYVRVAHKKGETIPPFLAVVDCEKAALMETRHALPLFKDASIEWSTAASQISKDTIRQIQPYIETHFVVYAIATHESEFIEAVHTAIREGQFIRTAITPDNLKQVFDKWVTMIGRELTGVAENDYALMFYADIMHDGKRRVLENLPVRLVYDDERPLFILNDKNYDLVSLVGYRRFWAIYHRPPERQHREYLLERRDSLLPIDERSFKGAYYTPLHIVDKAYDLLAETLGKNWQDKYIVWDMCCGVGNLEVKHSNPQNVFISTLDQADLDLMNASGTCSAATRFQYDYLNDDIEDFCGLNYTMSKKVPLALRQAIADARAKKKGAKKILVLMNPPYAEAGSALGQSNKNSVSKTRAACCMMENYGKASNELFAQFLARIQTEMPNAVVATFSTLKYLNASNFESFRQTWRGKYLGGFVVHSKAFDGLKGNFPIGFLVWDTSKEQRIENLETLALNKAGSLIGFKEFRSLPSKTYLNTWLVRPKPNGEQVVPLKNAVSVYEKKNNLCLWSKDAIAYMWCQNNDLQHSGQQTALFSSVWGDGHGFYVNAENLWQAATIFSVRQLIGHTWLNHNDQFMQPTEPLTPRFKTDCLIYMLFHGKNLTASANDLEWNSEKWSIVNHFIPFAEAQVGARSRFESHFMENYLKDKTLSKEAKAVMDEGLKLWQAFFSITDERKVREELKLNRTDVGWYQVRKALEARNAAVVGAAGIHHVTDFSPFKAAYEALSEKLRPMVYELGFLK